MDGKVGGACFILYIYFQIAKKDIVKTIENEFSGDAQAGYKALALVAKYRPAYFAKQLHKSMKGAGTNDAQLIRIMAIRSEVRNKKCRYL